MRQIGQQLNPHSNLLRPESRFRRGAIAAWPICLGYFPVGLALGALARQAGLPCWAVGLMSLLVFAGSAQFIAISMLTAGASPLSIILTTLIVNLRHTLMSSALAVHLQGVNRWILALFAYGITDESFAVNMTRFKSGNWDYRQALVVNHLSNGAWVASTVAGAMAGQFIPSGAFGINYALTGMFIALLSFQLRNRIHVVTGLVTGAVSIAWYLLVPGNSYIVGAAVGGATIGYYLKRQAGREK